MRIEVLSQQSILIKIETSFNSKQRNGMRQFEVSNARNFYILWVCDESEKNAKALFEVRVRRLEINLLAWTRLCVRFEKIVILISDVTWSSKYTRRLFLLFVF